AYGLDGQVDADLMRERLAELTEMQDAITARKRDALIGEMVTVLIDEPGIGRSHREAPEIDGVVHVDAALQAGSFAEVVIEEAWGPDLVAVGGVMPDGDEEIR
ncbi:MAG: 30S ribosomal protein S12 methylthiotransferase RimO, partial [Actinomycetota bacterium]|nr:30S ribosomal protein S12 methylthiotransferase RimO [Actinomycetota bacterium]